MEQINKQRRTFTVSALIGEVTILLHCLTYAEHCKKAAQTMRDMAAMHEEMAKKVK